MMINLEKMTSGDADIGNYYFSLVLCHSLKRTSILPSSYVIRKYKNYYRVSGFVFDVVKQ